MHDLVHILRFVESDELSPDEIAQAADEIEWLRAENKKLTETLIGYRKLLMSVGAVSEEM